MGIFAVAMVMACPAANAQRHHHHHRAPRVVTVVRPAVAVNVVSNSLDWQNRLSMAVAYLDSHRYLTVKKYAKMTGLTKSVAEAELDAFASDKGKPIVAVAQGKKKVYAKRG